MPLLCEEMGLTGNTLCDTYELLQLHAQCQFLYSTAVTLEEKIQHVLKYMPVSVLACLLFAAYLFNALETSHHHCLSYICSSTDGTHLPINFSDILPLWEIESPPSHHVWSDLPPGTPSLSCTDVCASYSRIGWYCPT